jgi:hypothetical protein
MFHSNQGSFVSLNHKKLSNINCNNTNKNTYISIAEKRKLQALCKFKKSSL